MLKVYEGLPLSQQTIIAYAPLAIPLILAAIAAAWGWWNRHWISKVFLPHAILAMENEHLRNDVAELRETNKVLLDQATSAQESARNWRSAAQSTQFTRREAEDILGRVSALEKYVPKFAAACVFIKQCGNVIVAFAETLRDRNIIVDIEIPEVPELIREDVDAAILPSRKG